MEEIKKKKSGRIHDGGWALWEILAAISILAVMGIVGKSMTSSGESKGRVTAVMSEAQLLLSIAHDFPQDFQSSSSSVNLTPLVVNLSTSGTGGLPSNMVGTGCSPTSSTGICSSIPGSTFSISQIPVTSQGATIQITLTLPTATSDGSSASEALTECRELESLSLSGSDWISVNGLVPGSNPTLSQMISACASNSLVWLSR